MLTLRSQPCPPSISFHGMSRWAFSYRTSPSVYRTPSVTNRLRIDPTNYRNFPIDIYRTWLRKSTPGTTSVASLSSTVAHSLTAMIARSCMNSVEGIGVSKAPFWNDETRQVQNERRIREEQRSYLLPSVMNKGPDIGPYLRFTTRLKLIASEFRKPCQRHLTDFIQNPYFSH